MNNEKELINQDNFMNQYVPPLCIKCEEQPAYADLKICEYCYYTKQDTYMRATE